MGKAFLGIEGSCFFGADRGGLVITSPVNVFSSPSDRLRTELVDMLQKGFITCTPNKFSGLCHQTRSQNSLYLDVFNTRLLAADGHCGLGASPAAEPAGHRPAPLPAPPCSRRRAPPPGPMLHPASQRQVVSTPVREWAFLQQNIYLPIFLWHFTFTNNILWQETHYFGWLAMTTAGGNHSPLQGTLLTLQCGGCPK